MFTPKKLYPSLSKQLNLLGIETPTDIQKEALPKIKSGSNVFVVAPAQSGKTMLAVIFLLNKLKYELEEEDVPRAIVIVPTKEKALIFKELIATYGKFAHLRVKCAYSEQDLEIQRDDVYLGADIVVGTAKRLGDLYSGTGLNIKLMNTLIVDDFDQILKQDALTQIERLSVVNPKVQKVFFATTQPSLMCKIIEKVSSNLIKVVGQKTE